MYTYPLGKLEGWCIVHQRFEPVMKDAFTRHKPCDPNFEDRRKIAEKELTQPTRIN